MVARTRRGALLGAGALASAVQCSPSAVKPSTIPGPVVWSPSSAKTRRTDCSLASTQSASSDSNRHRTPRKEALHGTTGGSVRKGIHVLGSERNLRFCCAVIFRCSHRGRSVADAAGPSAFAFARPRCAPRRNVDERPSPIGPSHVDLARTLTEVVLRASRLAHVPTEAAGSIDRARACGRPFRVGIKLGPADDRDRRPRARLASFS